MGWCSEFGPHINEGCNRAMVAGPRSCTCPECQAVCTGRYDGCPSVWAAGPREVHLLTDGSQPVPAPLETLASRPPVRSRVRSKERRPAAAAAGNGNGGDHGYPNGNGASAVPEVPVTAATGSVALHILLTELRIVQSRLDQVHRLCVASANDEGAKRAAQLSEAILEEFEALPNRIAGALAAALQEQHRRVMDDVRSVVNQTIADLRPAP